MLQRHSLERRLFGWLLVLALLPPLAVLGAALGVGAGSIEWIGTLGPWDQVAESGRQLFQAAEPAAAHDPALASALERHRGQLSESLVQARRWSFLGSRIAASMPLVVAFGALLIALLVLWLSRRLARELARPIQELVLWADAMARGQPLPAATPLEAREVNEVRALRTALRTASSRIREGRRQALEAERMRAWGEMARRVAHEMKNPLTPLRLATHRLAQGAPSPADLEEAVSVIGEETERLEELSRLFSVLGRPSAGPPSEVDLAELLEGLLASDVPAAVRRTLHVEPGGITILGHHDALVRAFRNLIRNAVEAMAGHPDAHLEVTVGGERDGGAVVTIADVGAGIPEEATERIFEPDFTLKAGGTGLGLAVVRQAVAAHRGTVSARNRPAGGAEFIVRLPAAALSAPADPPVPRPRATSRQHPEREGH